MPSVMCIYDYFHDYALLEVSEDFGITGNPAEP